MSDLETKAIDAVHNYNSAGLIASKAINDYLYHKLKDTYDGEFDLSDEGDGISGFGYSYAQSIYILDDRLMVDICLNYDYQQTFRFDNLTLGAQIDLFRAFVLSEQKLRKV